MKIALRKLFLVCLIGLFCLANTATAEDYYTWLSSTLNDKGIPGGEYLIGGVGESQTLGSLGGSASRSLKTVSGQKFTRSVEVNVAAKPANFWESNMQLRNKVAFKKGDMVLATFFMCCNYAADATASCESYLSFKQNSDNGFIWGKSLKAGTEWRQYTSP